MGKGREKQNMYFHMIRSLPSTIAMSGPNGSQDSTRQSRWPRGWQGFNYLSGVLYLQDSGIRSTGIRSRSQELNPGTFNGHLNCQAKIPVHSLFSMTVGCHNSSCLNPEIHVIYLACCQSSRALSFQLLVFSFHFLSVVLYCMF